VNSATIYHPRMVSIPASPYCELARWALDHWRIVYDEECHAPISHTLAARPGGGGSAVPILDTGEAILENARDILEYYEARSPLGRRLFTADSAVHAEPKKLFDSFFDTLGPATLAWTYSYLLPLRDIVIPLWADRASFWEGLALHIGWGAISDRVRQHLALKQESLSEHQSIIDAAFAQVESQIVDGRRYLMGDHFTAADLAFAAMASPVLLPAEYGGPSPALANLPPAMRVAVERWRTQPAGQFVLRLYKEDRPQRVPDLVAQGKHGSGTTIKDRLANLLIRPCMLRPVFGFLRKHFPVAVIGKHAIVSRHDDVVEILNRTADFTLSQVNAQKIDEIDGPFILGMDQSPQYDQENAILHQVVKREDLEGVREFVAQAAVELIDAARPRRRIDVVNGLARVVAVRLVASYFGIPGSDEPTMMRWMRDIFHYIFADLTNDESVRQDALNSAAELRRHMDDQIALRKVALAKPNQTDDVLGRLLALEGPKNSWLDDHAVRRNLAGVIVGAVDTTSKFVALAIDELLRRPAAMAKARDAAVANDIETVRRYAWEAVRFNPHHPLLVRYSARETRIAAGQPRSKGVPAGTFAYVVTFSAMFDPAVFKNPDEFDATRTNEYLHFGYNLHACFGRYINAVQIPELVAALLRLTNLRRAPGDAGQILYDGPFPNRLVLEFDA